MKCFMMLLVVYGVLSLLCGCVSSVNRCSSMLPGLPPNTTWEIELRDFGAQPRDLTADHESWNKLSKKLMDSAGFRLPATLKEVSLHDVRLTDTSGVHWQRQQTAMEYLLILEVDRLLYSFRNTSGLPFSGEPYGGWESPDIELRGHFVGHYLSATALMWASTHNDTLKERMTQVVSGLAACQDKMDTGYLSAFPEYLFDRFEYGTYRVWAPYYTIHKIMAGLLDQYTIAGNNQALKMTIRMADYFYKRVKMLILRYSIERHYQSLNTEVGGMSDVSYRLYSLTHDHKHLLLAHLFDKPCFLGLLAVKADDITGLHANTHLAHVVGAQMRYEVSGDPLYKDISAFFMDILNSSHTYATGGTSHNEYWSVPKRIADILDTETAETCATYNLLKVTRNLFRWTKKMAYADYYEHALTNGILSVQRGTDPGAMLYLQPQCSGCYKGGSSRGWGTQFDSFVCCQGTGLESFSKLGDSIYFEEEGIAPGLYIIQYISSSLDWKSGNIFINQDVKPVVSWNPLFQVTLTISLKEEEARESTLNLRIPHWAQATGIKATLNGQVLPPSTPGTFLSVTRKWNSGDIITLELLPNLWTKDLRDDRPRYASIKSIFNGPYLLAGMTSKDWTLKTGKSNTLSDYITPIPEEYHSQLLSISQASGNPALLLSNINQQITMESFTQLGTDQALRTTFRLIIQNSPPSPKWSIPNDAVDKLVMLEPIDFPGMAVARQGDNETLVVSAPADNISVFHLVAGLNGKPGTFSFEASSQKGCFVYTEVNGDIYSIKLQCLDGGAQPDDGFKEAVSFVFRQSTSSYHPISFVAKGAQRNYLLAPFYSFTDESYAPYFDFED